MHRSPAFILVLVFLAGCAGSRPTPHLSELYDRSARFHDARRNPIILVPGILGSSLIDSASGRVVWGSFTGDWANPTKPDGARLLALPMREGAPLHDLHDDVTPHGVLDRVKLKVLGLPIDVKAYYNILDALGIGGYKDESGDLNSIDYGPDHFTCFQFDYDWRLDNVENAARLKAFIAEKRAYVRREYTRRYGPGDYDVKFDIVAHSMGGLLTRYFLRYGDADLPADGSTPTVTWAGAADVDRVILVAPPNAGSLHALDQLIHGRKFGLTVPRFPAAVIGTMPAVYQNLPRGRHGALVDAADPNAKLDPLDPDLWEAMGWGLADPDQDATLAMLLPDVPDAAARRRIARDHLRKSLARARQFMAALDQPAKPPDDITIYLMTGDAIETPAVATVDRRDGRFAIVAKEPGDGTVLRSSALMDERIGSEWQPFLVSPIAWSQVYFLFTEHLEITKDPAFTDNILYLLLEQPPYFK
jgi:hypothetical protein